MHQVRSRIRSKTQALQIFYLGAFPPHCTWLVLNKLCLDTLIALKVRVLMMYILADGNQRCDLSTIPHLLIVDWHQLAQKPNKKLKRKLGKRLSCFLLIEFLLSGEVFLEHPGMWILSRCFPFLALGGQCPLKHGLYLKYTSWWPALTWWLP